MPWGNNTNMPLRRLTFLGGYCKSYIEVAFIWGRIFVPPLRRESVVPTFSCPVYPAYRHIICCDSWNPVPSGISAHLFDLCHILWTFMVQCSHSLFQPSRYNYSLKKIDIGFHLNRWEHILILQLMNWEALYQHNQHSQENSLDNS